MNPGTASNICPTCKKSGNWFATAWGPFCSKRCKLIDLGKWLGGEQVISEPLRPEHLEQYGSQSPDHSQDNPESANN